MRLYMEVYFQILNICSFDCATVTGSWKVKPLNLRLTISVGWVLSLQLTVLSRSYPLGYRTFLVVLFCVTFTIHCLSFRGVCHMTASDRFLFSTNAVRSYKASFAYWQRFILFAQIWLLSAEMRFVRQNWILYWHPPQKKKKKKKLWTEITFADRYEYFQTISFFLVYRNFFCQTEMNYVLIRNLFILTEKTLST